jgi:hypothetical protein
VSNVKRNLKHKISELINLFRIPDLPIEIKCYKNNCGYLIKDEILVRMKAIIIFSKHTYSY